MSIRLSIWIASMVCAALLLVAFSQIMVTVNNGILSGVLVLAVFAPIGWLLIRLSYAPVRGVTRTARSITSTGQLDRRCFYSGPRDDVGDLVVVVNELLVRYDAAVGRLRRAQESAAICTCVREPVRADSADLVVVDLLTSRFDSVPASEPSSKVNQRGN